VLRYEWHCPNASRSSALRSLSAAIVKTRYACSPPGAACRSIAVKIPYLRTDMIGQRGCSDVRGGPTRSTSRSRCFNPSILNTLGFRSSSKCR